MADELLLHIVPFIPMLPVLCMLLFPIKKLNCYNISVLANSVVFFLMTYFFIKSVGHQNEFQILVQTKLLSWSPSLGISYGLQLDSLNIPFVWSASVVFLIISLAGKDLLERHLGKLAALQLCLTCVLGIYSAESFFVFAFFAAIFTLPASFLIGLSPEKECKALGHRFAVVGALSVFFIFLCFFGDFFGKRSTETDEILSGMFLGKDFFALVLLGALLVRCFVIPVYPVLKACSRSSSLLLMLPVFTVGNFGIFAIFKYVLQGFPAQFANFSVFFLAVGLVTIGWSGLGLIKCPRLHGKFLYLAQIFNGMALTGFGCLNRPGLLAVLWTVFFMNLVLCLGIVLLALGERVYGNIDLRALRERRSYFVLLVISVLAAFCFPVSMGFQSIIFLFWGLGQVNAIVATLLGILLLPALLVGCHRFLFSVPTDQMDGSGGGVGVIGWRDALCSVPIFLLLTVLAVYPDLFSVFFMNAVNNALDLLGR